MSVIDDGPPPPEAGIFGLDCTPETSRVVLIPVPFDATASYGLGAEDGPRAILKASHQLDLFDVEIGSPYAAGICMLDEDYHVRMWNSEARELVNQARAMLHDETVAAEDRASLCTRIDGIGDQLNAWLDDQVRQYLQAGRIVGVVGGDHSVPFAAVRAHLQQYPDLGLLHVDAHADLREAYEGFTWSHASILNNIVSKTNVRQVVQVGVRDLCEAEYRTISASEGRIQTFFDHTLAHWRFAGEPFDKSLERIVAALPEDVYVTFDIDGLDPALCPGTGTPVPGGLGFREASALLAAVVRSGRRIVGFDLVEVAPSHADSEWDGNVGARILYKLCGHALSSAR